MKKIGNLMLIILKKFSLYFIMLVTVVACNKEFAFEEVMSEHFTASTEYTSRTSLSSDLNILWSKKDEISVFEGSTVNRIFKVSDSSDGKTSANLVPVSSSEYVAGTELDCNIAYYPYDEDNSIEIATSGTYKLAVSLPDKQKYSVNSFGPNVFPMVAVTSTTSDKYLSFRNICGILKFQIAGLGSETVRSIIFTGNNGEVIAGDAMVTAKYNSAPSIEMTGSGTAVFLDCGKSGVMLSNGAATIFEIVLPPITFTKGFTVTVICSDGKTMNISTTKSKTIMRSNIMRMASVDFNTQVVSNIQTGLPILVINTPECAPITSKEDWLQGATYTIINPDKSIDCQGTLSIKGRGNSTWNYAKKPYALRLDKKTEVLGMPKHKRWCLLANYKDRTMIRNAVAFEIARKCPGLAWTPRGEFVEVILNGKHIGNYYLCEQIKVDKNRVDIEELDNTVTEGEGITGGFIMELDTYFDEINKFKSSIYNLPWMFKDPDEVNGAQSTYMQNYVDAMEHALFDEASFAAREFTNYMDLESFVDWWFVYELAMNGEPLHPKSCYMFKDQRDVIKAGPVWDFDYGTFTPHGTSYFCIGNALYYGRLFEDASFRSLVKTKWLSQKSKFEEIAILINNFGELLSGSDEVNHQMWPISGTTNGDESLPYVDAIDRMKKAYQDKLSWMDSQISAW